MIAVLGGSGYIGSALLAEIKRRHWPYHSLARRQLDYTSFSALREYLERNRPALVINAAGFTGRPNVDACETARADTLLGNTLLPQAVAHACAVAHVPLAHISSGCIYTGAKVLEDNQWRIERDLMTPALARLRQRQPEMIHGFTETDEPNFSFRHPPCSVYSGTKALAEEALEGWEQVYGWRLRIPFDEVDHSRNYLSKLQRYPRVYDNVNSISHRGDFARASLDLWERRAPFGIYNITNPGYITTQQVVSLIQEIRQPNREFLFWANDQEFYREAAKAPRSNCILDTSKLLATGVEIRPVTEALEAALREWKEVEPQP